MRNKGYGGDIIHNPLAIFPLFWKILGLPKKKTRLFSNVLKNWYSFRKKYAIFIIFGGEGVKHPKEIMIHAFF